MLLPGELVCRTDGESADGAGSTLSRKMNYAGLLTSMKISSVSFCVMTQNMATVTVMFYSTKKFYW